MTILRPANHLDYSLNHSDTSFSSRFNKGLKTIINQIASNAGMQAIINCVADIFGLAVGLLDTNYSYLAFSKDYPELFASLGDDVTTGYLPLDVQDKMNQINYLTPLTHTMDRFILT